MVNIAESLTQELTDLAISNGLSTDDMLRLLINTYHESSRPNQVTIKHDNPDTNLLDIHYKGLFEQSNDAIFLIDFKGNHINVNQHAVDLLGYTHEELLNLSIRELVKDDELHETLDVQSVLLSGEKVPIYERTLRHKDGTEIPVEVNVACIFSDEGEPLYIQAMNRDIRERRALLQEIQHSELRYRTILQAMAEGIVIHDAEGKITMANPAAENLIGLTADQMNGLTPLDPSWHIIKEDGSIFAGEEMPASVSLAKGIIQLGVIMGVHKPDGDLTWLSVTSVPLKDADGNITDVVVTFSDFTKVMKAQKQAVKLAVERARVHLITDFVQNSSHEFRTPLSIIQTSAYFLQRQNANNPKALKQISDIEHQVKRITKLVDTLLLMAKLDSISDMRPQLQINLSLLLSDMVLVQSSKPNMPKINLHIDDTTKNITVPSLSNYLVQGLQAVINNAIHYSDNASEIDITLTKDDNMLCITITDYGIGIADEDMPHIFTRFWRKDTAHTREGLGLGLSIAQRVIELHRGHIDVKSDVGQGTSVTIHLPISNKELPNSMIR